MRYIHSEGTVSAIAIKCMHGNNIERRVLQMVRNCLKYDARSWQSKEVVSDVRYCRFVFKGQVP